MNNDTENKVLTLINTEWEEFLATYKALSPHPNDMTILALKAGFYSGFKSGVIVMHDANKIGEWEPK